MPDDAPTSSTSIVRRVVSWWVNWPTTNQLTLGLFGVALAFGVSTVAINRQLHEVVAFIGHVDRDAQEIAREHLAITKTIVNILDKNVSVLDQLTTRVAEQDKLITAMQADPTITADAKRLLDTLRTTSTQASEKAEDAVKSSQTAVQKAVTSLDDSRRGMEDKIRERFDVERRDLQASVSSLQWMQTISVMITGAILAAAIGILVRGKGQKQSP
jgi:uncharacterized protein YoxC